jgi:formate dehydrogenase iron-sulfur subunit
MTVGLLFDSTRCVACGECSSACKAQNKLPGPVEDHTTAYTWTTVETIEDHNVRRLCMHCLVPTCVSVCPIGALTKSPEGPVVYDGDKCMGCRYCMMACPFDVPKYEWNKPMPVVGKCIMCTTLVKKGEKTACATACQYEATVFGERKDLIMEAQQRMRANPTGYNDYIYGVKEAGGTGVLMLASVPYGKLGLKTNLGEEPPPMRTWQVLSKIPDFVGVWGASLYAVHWITSRRDDVSKSEGGHE